MWKTQIVSHNTQKVNFAKWLKLFNIYNLEQIAQIMGSYFSLFLAISTICCRLRNCNYLIVFA